MNILKTLLEESTGSLVGREILYKFGTKSDQEAKKRPVTSETRNEKWLGHFYAPYLGLTSLEGSPKEVELQYVVGHNKLKNLKGAPEIVGDGFSANYNRMLASFEGAPRKVNGSVLLESCNFTNLKDIHKHFKEINGSIYFDNNPIQSHVLGVFLIKGLKKIFMDTDKHADLREMNVKVQKIVNKYLHEGRAGLPKAQNELIEAGLEEYAQV